MKFIVVLVAGIALWLLLSGLVKLLNVITMSEDLRKRIRRVLPGMVLVLCLAYLLWSLNELLSREPFYPVIVAVSLSIVLLPFVWFLLRDLVAGVVFATKHPDVLGRRIEAKNVSGHVLKVGYTGLRVRADDGQILSVPYVRIVGQVVAEQSRQRSADQFRFTLPIPGEDDAEMLQERITREILLSPWVNLHLPHSVRIVRAGSDRS
ncbi:MAG: mechanosensitive ion channel domain-containing protein, partial [Bacteroidota bacterium]